MKAKITRIGYYPWPDREWEVYKNDDVWRVHHPLLDPDDDLFDKAFASHFDAIQTLIELGYLP